jgi:hypothetical protein
MGEIDTEAMLVQSRADIGTKLATLATVHEIAAGFA